MILHSLIRENQGLVPAEVEVMLLPGLPQIHVLGLPDQVIKESLHRVRCALRTQGFQWPRARQILVNIRPVDRRKSSRGLELAIAAGILWEMKQLEAPASAAGERTFVYGELSLSGEVREPDDLALDFTPEAGDVVLTGTGGGARGFVRERITTLHELAQPVREEISSQVARAERPALGLGRSFTEDEARALAAAALGGHHWLLAGAAGAGKSTLARSLISFLAPPLAVKNRAIPSWRPWVAPHHSTPAISLLGGGIPLRAGEISRADGGVLFLDELLEFPRAVQEALREPVEEGEVRLSRAGRSRVEATRFQLVATTNLCPCGRWLPGDAIACGRNWRSCRSVLERISGPFVDRFEMLSYFGPRRSQRTVTGSQILARVESARAFREAMAAKGGSTAAGAPPEDSWARIAEPWLHDLREGIPFASERRRLATVRVAQTLADLEESDLILGAHVEEAIVLSWKNFETLRAD